MSRARTLSKLFNTDGNLNLSPVETINGNAPFGRKNLVINGAMQVSQRGTTFTSPSNGDYTIDRIKAYQSGGGTYDVAQDSEAPDGFQYSLELTNTGTDDPAAGDYYIVQHRVEGYNVAHLDWGTSNAKSVTLSFWVRSSVTGTYSIAMVNADSNRSYPQTYTIDAANTWEHKTITVPGDTSGTWGKTNGEGIRLNFDLGSGSNFLGTAGAWASANYHGAIGQTEWINNSSSTWYITGIQLEAGSTASDFDHRLYGEEFILCQRYFMRFTGANGQTMFGRPGFSQTNAANRLGLDFPNEMRAPPTYSENNLYYWDGVNVGDLPTPGTTRMHTFSFDADYVVTSITTLRPLWFFFQSSSSHLTLDAEL